ncbi:MAG TPA: bifunctional oligoribonuclease/PAP phosphatase NrnA [Bacteroidales bacterium]|nr:bifunctional oligoribonuclease/PAP phosphatase NrnA [Bacteroidales bacterium]
MTDFTLNIPDSLKNLLHTNPRKILITTHLNPDGDAIGSVLALYHFLNKLNHEVVVVTPNDFPEFLKWMPGSDNILIYTKRKRTVAELVKKADIIFTLDFNVLNRLGDFEKEIGGAEGLKIMIDHHPDPGDYAKYTFSHTVASSTGELIYHFIKGLSGLDKLDENIATCIYTGIMTDTGSFSYNSSSSETFRIIADLLKFPINKDYIHSSVYDNYSENRMRLMGYCLNKKMIVLKEYNAAFISITSEELKNFNFVIGDTEGFVNLPFSIKGIVFTALFIEKPDHVKLSFRSKGNFSVNDFARSHFEGGGHLNAAGGESKLSLDEAVKKFRDLLPEYKNQLSHVF